MVPTSNFESTLRTGVASSLSLISSPPDSFAARAIRSWLVYGVIHDVPSLCFLCWENPARFRLLRFRLMPVEYNTQTWRHRQAVVLVQARNTARFSSMK